MTDKQYKKFMDDVDKEMDEFKNNILQNSNEEIYNRAYEITAYKEIYIFLSCEGNEFDRKGFAKKHILQDIFYEFMDSEYDVSQAELRDFISAYTEDNIKNKRFADKGELEWNT